MKFRKKVSYRKSKRMFSRNAKKVHKKNEVSSMSRGGTRL